VTTIDWLIVAFCVLLALYGFLQGFIVGALSLFGFAVGAFLGTRLGPLVLPGGSHSHYAPLFGLLGALLAGGVLATGLEGIGLRARRRLRIPGFQTVDGVLGGLLTACVGLGIAWIVGAVVLQSTSSSSLRQQVQQSAILGDLNALLPPSGPILNALARFDPLPTIRGPAATVPPPSRGIVAAPGVRDAGASVVRVVGTACGLGIEGSGWVAAPDLVVTNAHVVAGENDTRVEVGGSAPVLPAEALDFDPHDDIAILRVPGLGAHSLAIAPSAPPGTSGAILGYPQDGPFNAQPGRIGQTRDVETENAYGQGPVLRSVTELRGLVRPGNSGGPVISSSGQVLATVFAAIATPGTRHGGFAVPNSLVRTQLRRAQTRVGPVGTGGCAG
jgi:S1-C subfamily serine protease